MSDAWLEQHYAHERPEAYLAELLPLLEERGVGLLTADYSGGGDEGGVNDVSLYARLVEISDGVPQGEQEIVYEGIDSDGIYTSRIWELCDEILSTQFGDWSGDWSASGTLYVDVAAKRCWKSGQVQDWIPDETPLDVTLGA